MLRKMLGVATVLALLGAGAVGLAGPASAAGVSVGFGSGLGFQCQATLTVVPSDISWGGRYGWTESGTVSGDGTCGSGFGSGPVSFTGSWERMDGVAVRTQGGCPPWDMLLSRGSPGSGLNLVEMTDEGTSGPNLQLIGNGPFTTPGIPFGTGSLFAEGATPWGIGQTDPVACAAWPTGPPTTLTVPGPPPFHITLDWNNDGVPVPTNLLGLCLTVQGVIPRTCLDV